MAEIQPVPVAAPVRTFTLDELPEAKDYYSAVGYAKIGGVFEEYECRWLRDAAHNALSRPGAEVQRLANGAPALLFWPQSPMLEATVNSRRIGEIVDHFIGPYARRINNQVYFREPGDGDQFGWHQDIIFRSPDEFYPSIGRRYLQTIIAIDEITEDNGAVEFIPYSHEGGDAKLLSSASDPRLRLFERGGRQGIKVTAKPGDVLLWSALTIHGSEPNVSDKPRMTFMNGFAPDSACRDAGKDRYPLYSPMRRR